MAVRALANQAAQHDSGAILRSVGTGFEQMRFQFGGHELTLRTEMLRDGALYYLPAEPRWDDGTPMPPELAARLQSIIEEIERFWGMQPEFRTAPLS